MGIRDYFCKLLNNVCFRAYAINSCLSVRNYPERLKFIDSGLLGGLPESPVSSYVKNMRAKRN